MWRVAATSRTHALHPLSVKRSFVPNSNVLYERSRSLYKYSTSILFKFVTNPGARVLLESCVAAGSRFEALGNYRPSHKNSSCKSRVHVDINILHDSNFAVVCDVTRIRRRRQTRAGSSWWLRRPSSNFEIYTEAKGNNDRMYM